MIPEEEEEVKEQQDPADQDTLVFKSEESEEEPFNTTVDTTSDDSAITMGKPVITAFISDHIQIPIEQVGCLQLTSQLHEFLDLYPPKSARRAILVSPLVMQMALFCITCCLPLMEGFLLAYLSFEACAGLGNDCERFCASRSLLGSYVHQESI